MEPIIYTQCWSLMCKTVLPLRLGHSRSQTLDGIPLSALVPLPCPSSPSIHSSLLTTSLYLPLLSSLPQPARPPLNLLRPLTRILCLAIIYTHPADLLHLSFPLPLPTPLRRPSHPPPIQPAISCMATSTRKHACWHSTGSGSTPECRSECPFARQQQGDGTKS